MPEPDHDELLIGITPAPSAEHAKPTLQNCLALMFHFEPKGDSKMGKSLVVWKDGVKNIRPLKEVMRLRDLKPGDQAEVFGQIETIRGGGLR